jgi:hypothetical protein
MSSHYILDAHDPTHEWVPQCEPDLWRAHGVAYQATPQKCVRRDRDSHLSSFHCDVSEPDEIPDIAAKCLSVTATPFLAFSASTRLAA